MRCPFCGAQDTKVVDSRLHGDGEQIRRRRRCCVCGERFNTYEAVALDLPRVIKRDGSRVPFDQQRLRDGMTRALEKRPVTTDAIDSALSHVCSRLLALGINEVQSCAIGELVMDELRTLDQVAYVRFASVYRQFEDIETFREEIERLQQDPSPDFRRAQLDLLIEAERKNAHLDDAQKVVDER